MKSDPLGRFALSISRRLAESGRGKRLVDTVLTDETVAALIEHRLGTKAAREAPAIGDAVPPGTPTNFDDLIWLFTPTYAARGLSELLLDEAVYLWRLLTSIDRPRVAELGRCRGGTTFLFAAAGASVLSIDNDAVEAGYASRGIRVEPFADSLERALVAAGLEDKVELMKGDVFTVDVAPGTYDLVQLDIPVRDPDQVGALFDRWWRGLRPGGRLILRDGREPRTPGVRAYAARLAARVDVELEDDPPGRFTVAVNV